VFGKGLIIWHPERIIVNSNSVVGNNCSISSGVVIAQAHDRCPRIGDNVEIMINGTVLGGISVASNTRIGANALVIKDILETNTTWAGVPAKKISKNKVQA
jgi:serine O-acetyltransferase